MVATLKPTEGGWSRVDWQTGGGNGSFFFIKGDQSVCLNYRGITTPPWGSSCQVAGKEALTDG